MHLREEKTLILIKPDGVKRGIIGDIIARLEQRGLKVIAMKMLQVGREHAAKHYPGTDEHCIGMGMKTLENYQKYAKNAAEEIGTDDPLKIGRMVEQWNIDFLSSGPVVALVVSGIHAIDMVRKITGHTVPNKADMGTIRGDYSIDSPTLANEEKRAIRNLVHASGEPIEAEREIQHWFKAEEIHNYKRSDEDVMF
jgi:nucleoside-diphosphate kinase